MSHAPDLIPPDDPLRTEKILAAAIELAEPEREAFVQAQCGNDTALREELRSLLAHGDDPGTLLDGAALGALGDGASDARETQPEPLPRLGEFTNLRRLGEGGMGVVYLAEQESLGREVALKVMRPEFSRSVTAAARFDREAKVIARLRHSNIVSVHAAGTARGMRYLAMELVPGRGLDEIVEEAAAGGETLPTSEVLRWTAEVARALDYAHREGILHRDVKPANIRITPEGRAILLDFGRARDLESDAVTLTEAFVGSPRYVAPERVGGDREAVDGRADVYSLGVVLYECLAGRAPFEGTSLEQVLHRIINEEPRALRAINRHLPREVAIVTGKAMEKDPAQRYQTAAAMADDLEALLAFRPIRARPVGVGRRLLKWSRRNPAAATGSIVAALALLVVAGLLWGHSIVAARARAHDAANALAEAERLTTAFLDGQYSTLALEQEYDVLAQERFARFFSAEEDERVADLESRIARLQQRRDHDFHRVMDLLRRAERLGADPDAVRTTRGMLYASRMLMANIAGDMVGAGIYRDLYRSHDPQGRVEEELRGRGTSFTYPIRSDPPGAEVHLFEYVDLATLVEGGEHRHVAVPVAGEAMPVEPGAWALRVKHRAGGLREGDLIFEIDGRPVRGTVLVTKGNGEVRPRDRLFSVNGTAVRDVVGARVLSAAPNEASARRRFEFERDGETFIVRGESLGALGIEIASPETVGERGDVRARVWHDGRMVEMELPRGVVLDTTAAPRPLGPGSLIGHTPIDDYRLAGAGHFFLVVRAEGYEEARRPIGMSKAVVDVRLLPRGTTPEGFVHVRDRNDLAGGDFWIMEHEVTMGEYVEFANDPETLRTFDASARPILIPRSTRELYWERGDDGRFALGEGFEPDWPVLGVSWHDANAYARWMTRKARAAGRSLTFALPTHEQWRSAAVDTRERSYPFGPRVEPKWVSSCYARPVANPEPVMGFPIDESPFGVYDMSGSVSEWLDTWWIEHQGTRRYVGGSWGDGGPKRFTIYGGNGAPPDAVSGSVGFRLVAR